jgi:hypothetical protein
VVEPDQREREPRGLVDLVQEGAKDALAGLERGLSRGLSEADAALAVPTNADHAPLLAATDLPELPKDGPLGGIGVRLDREADLLRSIALRELTRSAWMERLMLIVVLATAVAEAGVAACATVSALLGTIEGRGGLFALAAIVLAGSAGGVAAVVSRSRVAHRAVADDALTRARVIEERIFRVALAMEWRASGATLYQDALARLERASSGE